MEVSLGTAGLDSDYQFQWQGDKAISDDAAAKENEAFFPYLEHYSWVKQLPFQHISELFADDPHPLNAQTCINDSVDVSFSPRVPISKRKGDDRSSSSRQSTSRKRLNLDEKTTRSTRFSAEQRAVLQLWLDSNTPNPYPTQQDKRELSENTGLTTRQIEAWFNRARLRKVAQSLKKVDDGLLEGGVYLGASSPLERYLSASPDVEAVEEGAMAKLICQSMTRIDGMFGNGTLCIGILGNAQEGSTHVPPSPPKATEGYASSTHSLSSVASASSFASSTFASFGPRKGRRRHYEIPSPPRPTECFNRQDKPCDNRASGLVAEKTTKEKEIFSPWNSQHVQISSPPSMPGRSCFLQKRQSDATRPRYTL